MGFPGSEIFDNVYVHHMNPMCVDDLIDGTPEVLDPEYLICVSLKTHNAIHFGTKGQLPKPFEPRRPGDTQLWRRRASNDHDV